MKRLIKVALVLVGVACLSIVGRPLTRMLAWQRDYREAERLFNNDFRPMSHEVRRFEEEHGRSPENLDEMIRFAPEYDFSALRHYPHEFSTTGNRRFYLRVNSRFAFFIDDNYWAQWWQPTGVLSAPTDPEFPQH